MPAVLQIEDMEDDFNPHYHTADDTLAHMDADYFVAQVQALAVIAARLAQPSSAAAPASAVLPLLLRTRDAATRANEDPGTPVSVPSAHGPPAETRASRER